MKEEVKFRWIIGVIAILAILALIYSIKSTSRIGGLAPFEKELPKNMNEVNSISENLLQAINNKDYPLFSRDFSQGMKLTLKQDVFSQTIQLLEDTSGKYISKEPSKFYEYGPYKIYQYVCSFEKENVTMTLSLNSSLVEGLYFDSDNLMKLENGK